MSRVRTGSQRREKLCLGPGQEHSGRKKSEVHFFPRAEPDLRVRAGECRRARRSLPTVNQGWASATDASSTSRHSPDRLRRQIYEHGATVIGHGPSTRA